MVSKLNSLAVTAKHVSPVALSNDSMNKVWSLKDPWTFSYPKYWTKMFITLSTIARL